MMTDDPTPDVDPSTDLQRIADFVALLSEQMRAQGLTSIDIEIPEARIRLRSEKRGGQGTEPRKTAPVVMVRDEDEDTTSPEDDSQSVYIEAPMIGTFYAAPGPGEPAFVEVGDQIEIGQTVAIIEAMKIMNEIVSDQSGTVAEILVRNAQAVEYGQPLYRLASE